jgi:hypothetical protein
MIAVLTMTAQVHAQSKKGPTGCQVYMDGSVVKEVTLEVALKWIELTPPTVQCDDGKVYTLETFQVNFFTLNPLQNREFGIGQGGFPLRAREAIANGKPGDAIVLKEVNTINQQGDTLVIPAMSVKLK